MEEINRPTQLSRDGVRRKLASLIDSFTQQIFRQGTNQHVALQQRQGAFQQTETSSGGHRMATHPRFGTANVKRKCHVKHLGKQLDLVTKKKNEKMISKSVRNPENFINSHLILTAVFC